MDSANVPVWVLNQTLVVGFACGASWHHPQIQCFSWSDLLQKGGCCQCSQQNLMINIKLG